MRPTSSLSSSALVLAAALLSGCATFKVENIDGLRGAYLDINRSYELASQVAERGNIPESRKQELRLLYGEARAAANSFLDSVKTRATAYTVDVPARAYHDDSSSKALAKFLDESRKSLGAMNQAVDYVRAASEIIKLVTELNDNAQEAAYRRFVKVLDDNRMKDWSSAVGPPKGR